VGIRAEDVSRLFVEFQQLDAGAAKKYQGTGLGLALTRRIVEAQGGRVGVTSTSGTGSLFFAILPRVAHRDVRVFEGPRVPMPIQVPPAARARVLVIDDDPSALKLLDAALRQRGFSLTSTDDPEVGLAAAAAHPPDLLIVDLVMPGMAGDTILERFRAMKHAKDVPVIIWTVKDLAPPERARLLTLAQAIVLKRDAGLSQLLERIGDYVMTQAPGARKEPS
jgi:CheY-like chemotaxis protein